MPRSKNARREAATTTHAHARATSQLIREFLKGGITVTVGGVPIQITLGSAQAAPPAKAPVTTGLAARGLGTKASAPRGHTKPRRRRARRAVMPDPRDIRGYLATQMEGSTLTALAHHFKVKRPQMKRMLARMKDRGEITLFHGAFFNNKRLRQRRIASAFSELLVPAVAVTPVLPEAQPVVDEAPVSPVAAVPDQPDEALSVDELDYPEKNAA